MHGIKRTVETNGKTITYTLTIKKVKNINLRIQSGEVLVSANAIVPVDKVDEFVIGKIDWIEKHLEEKDDQEPMITDDYVVIFGKRLRLKITKAKRSQVYYESDVCYINLKENDEPLKVLDRFLHQLAHDVCLDIAYLTLSLMKAENLEMPKISIRKMKTRWGSCNPSKGTVSLNVNLMHYPIEFIEYVVLHEFVHFIQPNHSKEFYAVIEKYMPDYKERIAMVK